MKAFPSIGTPRPVAKAPKVKTPKWKWIVIFRGGDQIVIPSARGARDARMQAMWIVREKTGAWPTIPILEVQRHASSGNGLLYVRYRTR